MVQRSSPRPAPARRTADRGTQSTPTPVAAVDRAESPRTDHTARGAEHADALAPVLARSVRERALQRYTVNPLPVMRHQWRLGAGLFFDPNCGWYTQVAAMRQRAASLGLAGDAKDLLPKSTVYGFSPGTDGAAYTRRMDKPANTAAWDAALQQHGAIMVSGELGGADWGPLGGVGHWILIVGADANTGMLEYMDPLQGNTVRTGTFAHMDPRIDNNAYRVWTHALTTDLNLLTGAPVAAN